MKIKNHLLNIVALAITSCAPVYADLSARQATVATQAEPTTTQQAIPTMQSHKIIDALELATQTVKPIKTKRSFISTVLKAVFCTVLCFLGSVVLYAIILPLMFPISVTGIYTASLACITLGTASLFWCD